MSFKSQISFQTGFSLFLFIIYPDQPLKSFWSMFSSSSHRLIMQVLVLCIKKYSLVTGSLRLISWCGTDIYLYCSVFFLFNFEVTSFRSLKTQKCLFYSYSTVRKQILSFYSEVPFSSLWWEMFSSAMPVYHIQLCIRVPESCLYHTSFHLVNSYTVDIYCCFIFKAINFWSKLVSSFKAL